MEKEIQMHTALIEHLRNGHDRRSLVFYRSEKEMKALHDWLVHPGSAPAAPASTVEEIAAMIRGCGKCSDIREKKTGYGTGTNGVMILLNAPQMIKQSEKVRMKKDSIEMMKRMMKAIDVDFEQCYITNLYKCESGTMKPSDLYKNCASILQREVEVLNPRTVVVMGELIPLKKIMDASPHIRWFSIPHPIILLRNPDMKSSAWNTLQLVKEYISQPGSAGQKS